MRQRIRTLLAVMLSLLLAFGLIGCVEPEGSGDGDDPNGEVVQPKPDEGDEKDPEEEDPKEDPVPEKVVMRMRTNAKAGRAYKILQLTDIQVIDPSQASSPDRLAAWQKVEWADREACAFSLARRLVAQTQPDFIIATGDNVYGEFDDNGSNFIAFVEMMESFETPWSFTFGNHDGEISPGKGMQWQCDYVKEHTEYCLFDQGEEGVDGYGNCVVDVYDGDNVRCSLMMLDSHGCVRDAAFTASQVDWYSRAVRQANKAAGKTIPSFLFFHIPTQQFIDAIEMYTPNTDPTKRGFGTVTANENHDFGANKESFTPVADAVGFWTTIQKLGSTKGIFVGHQHVNNSSILYQGVRLTFGTKTGVFDYYDAAMQGGTLITVGQMGTLSVKHVTGSTENK